MDELTRQVAQMALRLSALPAEAIRNDNHSLDVIEQLALRILREICARRVQAAPLAFGRMEPADPRETRGPWCIQGSAPAQRTTFSEDPC